jgi:limonene-1,2-epoxide hydrolase
MADLPQAITSFFAAINERDVEAVGRCLTEDIVYHLIVPLPPATGLTKVLAALGASITEADRVSWEVAGWARSGDQVFVERIDRFWFGDREAAIECTGVFELRDDKIAVVRDYADLGTWRQRKQAALAT